MIMHTIIYLLTIQQEASDTFSGLKYPGLLSFIRQKTIQISDTSVFAYISLSHRSCNHSTPSFLSIFPSILQHFDYLVHRDPNWYNQKLLPFSPISKHPPEKKS